MLQAFCSWENILPIKLFLCLKWLSFCLPYFNMYLDQTTEQISKKNEITSTHGKARRKISYQATFSDSCLNWETKSPCEILKRSYMNVHVYCISVKEITHENTTRPIFFTEELEEVSLGYSLGCVTISPHSMRYTVHWHHNNQTGSKFLGNFGT